jgi:hypothetical protein
LNQPDFLASARYLVHVSSVSQFVGSS